MVGTVCRLLFFFVCFLCFDGGDDWVLCGWLGGCVWIFWLWFGGFGLVLLLVFFFWFVWFGLVFFVLGRGLGVIFLGLVVVGFWVYFCSVVFCLECVVGLFLLVFFLWCVGGRWVLLWC